MARGVGHTEAIDPRLWMLLAIWPAVVLGAEAARKAVFRRRALAAPGVTHLLVANGAGAPQGVVSDADIVRFVAARVT